MAFENPEESNNSISVPYDPELPTDYHGVVFVPFDEKWKDKLLVELMAAGLIFDPDKGQSQPAGGYSEKSAPEPYVLQAKRPEKDPIVGPLIEKLGGLVGPAKPIMVVRHMVSQYRGDGFIIQPLDDGREVVATWKVSDGSWQEVVLMSKTLSEVNNKD